MRQRQFVRVKHYQLALERMQTNCYATIRMYIVRRRRVYVGASSRDT